MKSKKSCMDTKNILNEGFFENLLKIFISNPALKKSKKFQNSFQKLNKSVIDLEDSINKELKNINPKSKKIKLKTYKLKDFT